MTDTPIIGILCVDISSQLIRSYGAEYESYIPASYVKFLEGAGARVVPIWIRRELQYYKNILSKINGIVLPGGAAWFEEEDGDDTEESEYSKAGKIIYNIAIEINLKGVYFPILGICLGYELLLFLSVKNGNPRRPCPSMNVSLPLKFRNGYKESKMFCNANEEVLDILQNEPTTFNFHSFYITDKEFREYNLRKDWSIMSTNRGNNNVEFISTVEHKRFPFYGLQFHPEKNAYEFCKRRNVSHNVNAIFVTQYFANFFVGECRKCDQHFETLEEEAENLIYNFNVIFTQLSGSRLMQCYLFKKESENE